MDARSHSTDARNSKICVIARDIDPFGHILREDSSAMVGLAQRLSAPGIEVTLYLAAAEPPSQHEMDNFVKHFDHAHGIRVELYKPSKENIHGLRGAECQSHGIYEYLKQAKFDAVYFPLEGGLAYYSLLSKEVGLKLLPSSIIIVAHSPLEWTSQADRFFFQKPEQVKIAHMERYCAENTDRLVAVNSSLLAWFAANDWKIPRHSSVIPPLRPLEWFQDHSQLAQTMRKKKVELVLVAGVRFRDGITLFCDTLDQLAKSDVPEIGIKAVGEFGKILGEHTGGLLLRRARRWPFSLSLSPQIPILEGIRYAATRNCIVVIPAFEAATGFAVAECIRLGVKFVATAVGGNVDEVSPEHHARVLAQPKAPALASLILATLRKPVFSSSRLDDTEKADLWLSHHHEAIRHQGRGTRRKAKPKIPLVSVIITHHDRPQYLMQAVSSVREQDYGNFEVILVDDGSKLPESHAALDLLEGEFAKKKWKIIRSENRYVGAARNLGVRSSRGEMIVFVDDDNALYPHAVSTFVNSLQHSGSDVCMAMAKSFYDVFVPNSLDRGSMSFFPLGGSLDLGFLTNCFGDTISIYRRSVFDNVGYQFEKFGYMVEDHEFFVRIALAGLKLRLIPEPLFWYRVSTRGRYRSSHYYDNQMPIIEAFRKHDFKGMKYVYDLFLGQNMGSWQTESYRSNLYYSPSDSEFLKLCELEPNSAEAFEMLAEIAASEARQDTALGLLASGRLANFTHQVGAILAVNDRTRVVLSTETSPILLRRPVTQQELKLAQICTSVQNGKPPSSYAGDKVDLFLEVAGSVVSIAVLSAACPISTFSVTSRVSLPEFKEGAAEFLLMLCAMYDDPVIAVNAASETEDEGSSGWIRVAGPEDARTIVAQLQLPSLTPLNLVLAVRTSGGQGQELLSQFSETAIQLSLEDRAASRPQGKPPVLRHQARWWTDSERKSTRLTTSHPSELPMLLFPKEFEQGLFLRPSEQGPIVAVLQNVFPAFASVATAHVEIDHAEAGPFEFSIALLAPGQEAVWQKAGPTNALAFSGWIKVRERFKLHNLKARLAEKVPSSLSVAIAVRLPRGSKPSPANAYFRSLAFLWED
ncbi:MAG: DUF6212 domain-containing protein [Aestuariivirga sp.]